MSGNERDLVTSEGVDEGSGESATEAAGKDQPSDLLGVRAAGTPDEGEQQAAPELVVTGQQEPQQPGQQQQVGER